MGGGGLGWREGESKKGVHERVFVEIKSLGKKEGKVKKFLKKQVTMRIPLACVEKKTKMERKIE